jgi:hypothetical protein
MIDEYVHAIEETVAALGRVVRGFNIYKDERESDFVFLRGEILFANGTSLHFREFVQFKIGQPPNRYKYAYHYQRADGTIIFRYDRARHYPDLSSAPHHKHVGETEVVVANAPDLQTVLKEIERLLKR